MTPFGNPTLVTAEAPVMNGLANRFMIPLLRSTAGGLLGRRLAVVDYLGRRTGQHHHLVAIYVTDGRTVRITVGMAEHKTWWRNFQTPHPLRLRLAGIDHDAVAHVVRDGGQVSVVAQLTPSADPPPGEGTADRAAPAGPP